MSCQIHDLRNRLVGGKFPPRQQDNLIHAFQQKEYEEITSFLKSKRIGKVDLIRIGYQALMQEFKKDK